jgi:ABC-2 type transport system ATP-binding protein
MTTEELEPGARAPGDAETADPAIEVRDLSVVRGGRPVLFDVSVQVAAGSVTGLLGPSGSGKTTLMRAIVGVQRIAGGQVTVLGRPAGDVSLRRRVAYVTQAPSVYADLSVEENLRYFASIVGAPAGRVREVLASVGLADARRQLVGALSGGQRSRVSLGSALLNRPEVLVLDEPTAGLDPILRADLWRTFHELAEARATLLVSSHQMDEARECDELLLMREGRILTHATPQQLRAATGADDLGDAFLAVIKGAAR